MPETGRVRLDYRADGLPAFDRLWDWHAAAALICARIGQLHARTGLSPTSLFAFTAAHPAVVGAVSVRAAALEAAGEDPGRHIVVKPTLITRDDLVKNDIKTIAEPGAKFPAFRSSNAASAARIAATE